MRYELWCQWLILWKHIYVGVLEQLFIMGKFFWQKLKYDKHVYKIKTVSFFEHLLNLYS